MRNTKFFAQKKSFKERKTRVRRTLNTPKEIPISPRVFSITPKVFSGVLKKLLCFNAKGLGTRQCL